MKVVHLTSVHSVSDPRIRYKECASLAACGYDVILIGPGCEDHIAEGVRVKCFKPAGGRLKRMLVDGPRALWLAARESPSLYHIHDPELLLWAQLLRIAGAHVVYDMHEHLPKSIQGKRWLPDWLRPWVAAIARAVERGLLAGMPVVFAEDSYRSDYPFVGANATVRNFPVTEELLGIDVRRHSRFTVGYAGAVSEARGSLRALQALLELERRGLPVHWDCVGPVRDEPTRVALGSLRAPMAERVNVVGQVPPREAWRRMGMCHVGLAILSPEPNYVESYPTKVFEYLALGVPVIVSDFPLYRRLIDQGRCGICIDPSDHLALSDAIAWMHDNPDEADAMGQRGRALVRDRYTWAAEANTLLSFYRTLGVLPLAELKAPNPW